ncbi:MAG: tripartite tricarboxylate transporter TctB family protein [Candidatus Tectomicrobia bacterium]|uniref:Tripartite tricarboxylate transporter TctB family protein n=1 Tax=Tectimicrobiota bacterium TaxID=2528274 RepID=A0A932MMK6_UNCTE|nr:tripartite tricarboxylate transporter TctB family protein [Candidatus Tectomicrobia bacterium]
MDRLIAEGGMREAQQFIRLTPVFFPRVAFGLMAVLGAIHGYRAWRQLSETAPPGPGSWIEKYRNVVLVGAFILAYALLLPKLGFTAATLVGIAAVTATLGSRTWWEILPVSLLSPLVIRFVFERVLLIALPRSDFEFIAVPEEALMKFLVRLFFFQF